MLRIDTHHHMIPPDYRKAAARSGNRRSRRTGGAGLERRGGRCRRWPNSTSRTAIMSVSDAGHHVPARTRPTRPRSPATSTTTPPTWSPRSPTGSGSSPPSRCRTSTNPSPKPSARSTTSTPTGSCCWPTTPAPTSAQDGQDDSVRRARRALGGGVHPPGRAAGPDGARRRAVRGRLPARHHPRRIPVGAQRHSPQVPEHPVHPEPRRRLRPVCVAPDGRGDHRRHRPQPGRHPRRLRRASTSTPRCHPVRPHCRPCWPSPSRDTSPSAPTGRSRPWPRESCFAAGLETYAGLDDDHARCHRPHQRPRAVPAARHGARAPTGVAH